MPGASADEVLQKLFGAAVNDMVGDDPTVRRQRMKHVESFLGLTQSAYSFTCGCAACNTNLRYLKTSDASYL